MGRKPKINKEVTVQELKIEIEGLNGKLKTAQQRINELERHIQKNGLNLPTDVHQEKQGKSTSDDDDDDSDDY